MKKIILLMILLPIFFSCKRSWTEKDKAAFVSGCLGGGAVKELGEDKAKKYCTCMLQKILEKYPNRYDARFIRYDSSVSTIGKECLKQP